jgi:hypothetical protein
MDVGQFVVTANEIATLPHLCDPAAFLPEPALMSASL